MQCGVQFLTRPFVVGDRVELKTTGGGTVLTGFVERIDVMRTLIRTDKSVPVAVPNRSITEMIVSNESRLGRSNVAANFKVHHSPAADSPEISQASSMHSWIYGVVWLWRRGRSLHDMSSKRSDIGLLGMNASCRPLVGIRMRI